MSISRPARRGSSDRAVNRLAFRSEEWGYTDLDSSGRPSLRPGAPGGSEEPHPHGGYPEGIHSEASPWDMKANWYITD